MDQQWRANSSGLDSAVFLRLKDKELSFSDNNIHILVRRTAGSTEEGRRLLMSKSRKHTSTEAEVYDTTYPPTPHNAALSSLSKRLNKHSHSVSGDSKNDGSQHLASGDFNDTNACHYNGRER